MPKPGLVRTKRTPFWGRSMVGLESRLGCEIRSSRSWPQRQRPDSTRVRAAKRPHALRYLGLSGAVGKSISAIFACTMSATVEVLAGFEPMTEYARSTDLALGCQRLDCAFKAIKRMSAAFHDHLECLVVIVATLFAYRHCSSPIILSSKQRQVAAARWSRDPRISAAARFRAAALQLWAPSGMRIPGCEPHLSTR
jgi:hypothetical protein